MANTREIQSRMKSIQDTMKITNAMYMISSSKMQKAKRIRHPYPDVSAELIWLVQSSTAKELFRFRH